MYICVCSCVCGVFVIADADTFTYFRKYMQLFPFRFYQLVENSNNGHYYNQQWALLQF